MRIILLLAISLLAADSVSASKKNESSLRLAAQNLDKALLQKDTASLDQMLAAKLQYGHSNGWIETKEEMKADLYNGKIVYNIIKDNGGGSRTIIQGNTGLVREEVEIDVLLNGKPVNLNLAVLQVWIFDNGDWKLIARQSTKVERH